ncbi:hypothetical protein [Nocardioides astragali]|uniref:Uncharacterized protein n=1 Tax=Nocardioides astragali TaxID=1776736 RepID=A0ABW2N7B9_9ACTN|nr:hypothetical protein [Nocardioides astragali]
MEFPTPDDPKQAPVWENYVIAQSAQASLRLIPTYAHALGVEVEGRRVTLVLQAPPSSPTADQDMADIVSELEALLGPDVAVLTRLDFQEECRLSPHDRACWFFASRA